MAKAEAIKKFAVVADMEMTIAKSTTVNTFTVTCVGMNENAGESITISVKTVYSKSDQVIKSIQPKLMKSGYVATMAVLDVDEDGNAIGEKITVIA